MSMPSSKETIEVITSVERRRRWPASYKARIGERDLPARHVGFRRCSPARHRAQSALPMASTRCARRSFAVGSGEEVVPAAEYRASQQQNRELQWLLGKKNHGEMRSSTKRSRWRSKKSGYRTCHPCRQSTTRNSDRCTCDRERLVQRSWRSRRMASAAVKRCRRTTCCKKFEKLSTSGLVTAIAVPGASCAGDDAAAANAVLITSVSTAS